MTTRVLQWFILISSFMRLYDNTQLFILQAAARVNLLPTKFNNKFTKMKCFEIKKYLFNFFISKMFFYNNTLD